MSSSLPPVPDIIRSAYATLVVTDLPEARRFWVDLLGLVVTYEDSSSLYLRGYDELTHHNLILRTGPAAATGPLGYRVRSAADLDLDGKPRPLVELAQTSEVTVGADGFTAPPGTAK
ncbi:MAG TPA: hypothetical protein VFO01_12650 [Trebonia sp.]|nr:hypothetical protein [Trebonia sp.]